MPGPITRHAADPEPAFAALSGQTYIASSPRSDLTIGVVDASFHDEETSTSHAIAAVAYRALGEFEKAGARCTPITLDGLREAVDSADVIAYEFATALAQDLAIRPNSPVDSLQTIVDRGWHHEQMKDILADRANHAGPNSPGYRHALACQAALLERMEDSLVKNSLDVLCYPTLVHPPTALGGKQHGSNALLAPVTGLPAVNLPIGFDRDGLPVGLELLAGPGNEAVLLQAARAWADLADGWTVPNAVRCSSLLAKPAVAP
ncbi:hypothetical protein GCM10028792_34710 [Salinisphaera aquimarina]